MNDVEWLYERLPEYKALNSQDKELFKLLYNYLILNGKITAGNVELSQELNIAVSTLKTQLTRLAASRLIKRYTIPVVTTEKASGYKSERLIRLNPYLFPMYSFECDKELSLKMYDWIVLLNDVGTLLMRGVNDLRKLTPEAVDKVNRRLAQLTGDK